MKKKKPNKNKEMLDNYDFSKGVQGKYYERYRKGTNIVLIDPDVAKTFPNAQSVNNALRALAHIIHQH